jgi:hypothetical protein
MMIYTNIAAISWKSVLLVKETEYQEKTTGLPQVTDKHSHIKYTSPWSGIKLTTNRTLVVICSDCTGSCRSSYQTITTTTVCLNRIQIFLISLHRSVLNCTRYLPFLTFHHEYLYKSFKWPCYAVQASWLREHMYMRTDGMIYYISLLLYSKALHKVCF